MRRTRVSDFFFYRIPLAMSIIFHPLIMPTFGIILLLYAVIPLSLMPQNGKQLIIILVFTFTFVMPLAFLPFLFYRKVRQFFVHNDRQERVIPLAFTVFMNYLAFLVLRRLGAPFLIQSFLFATTISIVFALLISFFWKISAHTIGIGGLTALVTVLILFYRIDMMLYLMITIVLSGIVASSRLGLESHTPAQVYLGYLVGFGVTFLSFLLL